MLRFAMDEDPAWVLFLFAFGVAAILVAQRLVQLVLRKKIPRFQEWLNAGGFILIIAVLTADAAKSIRFAETSLLSTLIPAAVVLVSVFVSWLYLRMTKKAAQAAPRLGLIMVLLIASCGVAAWSAQRFYATTTPTVLADSFYEKIPGHSIKSTRFAGVTDLGREVELYRWKPDTDHDKDLIRALVNGVVVQGLPATIQRADYDTRSNCHGWVFTSGRFLLKGDGVARILEDNGYQVVTDPQSGDVVIYRINGSEEISHTGLVQGVLGDGTVIVESKWSVGGRYLHRPQDQPYSPVFTYYRTTRQNHVVSIRFRAPALHASNGQAGDQPARGPAVSVTGMSAAG
jgi:hypothetical protein